MAILTTTNHERTDEQREIVTAARHRETFAVRAFAGSGKTSTLRAIGSELGAKRVLYLAFNREIVREGRAVFPSTTSVATAHGFARRTLVGRYSATIDDSVPPLEQRLRAQLGLPVRRGDVDDAREIFAERIETCLERFIAGTQPTIVDGDDPEAATQARAVWSDVYTARAVHSGDHDLYAKLCYVLQSEHGHPHLGFDVILYDECQDCSGAMFGTARGQTRAQQIYMGDPAQAIYAFRGATDAFVHLSDLTAYPLTTSFRFGRHVATLADRILDAAGPHAPIQVLPRKTDRVVSAHEGCPEPDVILTRSQQQVLDTALGEHTRGRKVAIVGTLEAGRLERLAALATDVHALREGRQPARFAKFASFQTLKWYAERKNVVQFRVAVSLVERFGDRVPDLLATLKEQSVGQDEADVVISTAHGFKGRQAGRVRIAGDFRPFASTPTPGNSSTIDSQELHLAYVAVTRAQSVLDITAYREALLASLLAAGAPATLAGIVEERVKLGTGMTNVPRALSRLVGDAGKLHAPQASIRVAVPSAKVRAEQELATVSARLTGSHKKPVQMLADESEFVGTFLETLAVSVSTGYAFVDGGDRIGIVPIDGSTLRSANVLRGKRISARNTAADGAAWTLRVTG